ncbi:MAG: histone deacetylase [Anaerolineae bacterium]|nr:histone deacetylase [Anaerolineae bacterium]
MKVFYADHIRFPLPAGHRFPAQKYALLRGELLRQGILQPNELYAAEPVAEENLLLAHTPEYVQAVRTGSLDARVQRQIGLPWSAELAQRSRASVGGSLQAARAALQEGIAGNLGGGTHHAMAHEGMGFCVFNDLAVVSLVLLQQHEAERVAVVDLDVHQGNGTAAILGSRQDVFLFSMHGANNYPLHKVPSTLDVDLLDDTGDEAYLEALDGGLAAVFAFQPQIVLYQAGVDALEQDRLGRLSLSMEGLARRDRLVIQGCRQRGIPIVLLMGGGYAEPIQLTVQAHVQTYRVAKEVFGVE